VNSAASVWVTFQAEHGHPDCGLSSAVRTSIARQTVLACRPSQGPRPVNQMCQKVLMIPTKGSLKASCEC